MNPIPDDAKEPAQIISEVRRVRDSCILLAGHRPYREFPLSWIKRHLEVSNFKILNTKNFTIIHTEESVQRQINVAKSKLPLFSNTTLRNGMEAYIQELEYAFIILLFIKFNCTIFKLK